MKTLLLLRHAKSSWQNADLADHDRPLNARGKRDAPRVGRLLRAQTLKPDLILSSTARRARQTTKGLVNSSGYELRVEQWPELYHADPNAQIELLSQQADQCACVMVVAHNPGLEELLAVLVGQYHALPTAALAQVELPLQHWSQLNLETRGQLKNLWRPRELE